MLKQIKTWGSLGIHSLPVTFFEKPRIWFQKVWCLTFINFQIIMWSLATGKRQNSIYLDIPNARGCARLSDTEVQFHLDQKHVLAIHETQLALYETTKLMRVNQVFAFTSASDSIIVISLLLPLFFWGAMYIIWWWFTDFVINSSGWEAQINRHLCARHFLPAQS